MANQRPPVKPPTTITLAPGWAMLHKTVMVALGVVLPLAAAWSVWITKEAFASKAFRETGDRFTATDGETLRREITDRHQADVDKIDQRLDHLPPADFRRRVERLEDSQAKMQADLAAARADLAKILAILEHLTKDDRRHPAGTP